PAAPMAKPAVNGTKMHLSSDVDTAYKQVGLVLQQGGIGTVTGQDPAQHSYQLSVAPKSGMGSTQGFMQKHFSNLQNKQGSTSSGNESTLGQDQGASTVTLVVSPAQGGGSTVSAHGDPQQAARVISVLSGRIGG